MNEPNDAKRRRFLGLPRQRAGQWGTSPSPMLSNEAPESCSRFSSKAHTARRFCFAIHFFLFFFALWKYHLSLSVHASASQVRYAALDALVLPHLYDHFCQLAQEVDQSAVTALQVLLPATPLSSSPTHNKDKGKKRKEKRQEVEKRENQMYVG